MFFMLSSSLFLLSYCSALFLSDSRNNHPKSSAHACCTGTTIRGRAFLSSTAIHLSTDNNRPDKFRVVTPESLSSLFGANSIPSKCNDPSSLTSDSLSDDSGDSSTAELEERDNSFEDSEFMDESLSITDVGDEDASDIDVDVNIDADSAFASENGTKNVRRVGRYIQIGNTAQSGSKIRTKVVSPSPGAAVILGGKDDGVGEVVRVWLNREPLRYTPALGSDKSASIAVPAAISSASEGSPSNHFQSSSSRATIRPLVSPDSALSDGVDLDGKLDNVSSFRMCVVGKADITICSIHYPEDCLPVVSPLANISLPYATLCHLLIYYILIIIISLVARCYASGCLTGWLVGWLVGWLFICQYLTHFILSPPLSLSKPISSVFISPCSGLSVFFLPWAARLD